MNLILSIEYRFERTPDGAVWTSSSYPYTFWKRYFHVFDAVRVVARVRDVEKRQGDWQRSDGEGVSFVPVTHYLGPWQYLSRAHRVRREVQNAVKPDEAVLLRIGSHLAAVMMPVLNRTGHPYAVEVVGDPYDVFAPGAIQNPLRPFFRWWFPRQLANQCASACAAAYVTTDALQRRYPCPARTVGASDVELNSEALVSAPRHYSSQQRGFTLIMVGMLAQLYKAPDILVDSVAACVRTGLNLKLVIVGEGKYRSDLQSRVYRSSIADRVRFLGALPAGEAVRAQLDAADLFVLPSRQEGLPRAMIEAMARALPCIGSTVGGIPELLPQEDLIPPNDPHALARKIREVVSNPERLTQMSARNLERARDYRDDILNERRTEFYRYLRDKTQNWFEAQN